MKTEVKEIPVTPLVEKTLNSKAKVVVHMGGARSSKSYSIAQALIWKMLNEENKVIGICRKTFPALRMSTYKLFLDLLTQYGIYDTKSHNKEFHTYIYGTNLVQFFSLDDPSKAASTERSYVWMEEANEFTWDDFMALQLRLSYPTKKERNQVFLSFNPIDGYSWLATKLRTMDDTEWIHSTYKDNPLLHPDVVKQIEDLISQDDNFYRIYALGEWGKLENLVYRNFKIVDSIPKYEGFAYGLDFGYTAPSALVAVYLCNGQIYAEQKIYETKLTNKDIIERLTHEERGDIYADSAEPLRIEEIYQAGHNVYPANKDVKMGIDILKRQTIHVHKDSPDLIKEIRGYQHKKDKSDRVLEEPVKFNDHLMDALRYACMGLVERFGFATASPVGEYSYAVVRSKGFCN